MGTSKTEVNLRRLIAAASTQQNHPKLLHYVATLRELLEQLSQETAPQGLARVSKAVLNDYSDKIEDIASSLAAPSSPPLSPKANQIPLRSGKALLRKTIDNAMHPLGLLRDSGGDPCLPLGLMILAKLIDLDLSNWMQQQVHILESKENFKRLD